MIVICVTYLIAASFCIGINRAGTPAPRPPLEPHSAAHGPPPRSRSRSMRPLPSPPKPYWTFAPWAS